MMMDILVSDYDTISRHSISEFLRKKGHMLRESADGIETLELIEREEMDILVLDPALPKIDGIEICRRIQKKGSRLRPYVILLFSESQVELMQKGIEAGADEVIGKPVNLTKLHARVNAGAKIRVLEKMLVERQKEFVDLKERKNKYIATVAHDLRNPLISIRGFSELLLKESHFNEEQNEFLGIIHTTSRNMLAMLNDLLDMALIDSGNLDISEKPGSINGLVMERVRLNSLQAKQKYITLHTRLSETPEVLFDSHRMGQAIDNLISNAIKFAPFGTNVYLTLQQTSDHVVFSVQDEGPGIPMDEQHLLFSEFHRLSIRPTAGETSTGLGLAITKKIMEAHGGSIIYDSREGSGSIFSLMLPIKLPFQPGTSAAG